MCSLTRPLDGRKRCNLMRLACDELLCIGGGVYQSPVTLQAFDSTIDIQIQTELALRRILRRAALGNHRCVPAFNWIHCCELLK